MSDNHNIDAQIAPDEFPATDMSRPSHDVRIKLSHRAQTLLEDPLFLDVVTFLSSKTHRLWAKAALIDDRERLWNELQGLNSILKSLRSLASMTRDPDEKEYPHAS